MLLAITGLAAEIGTLSACMSLLLRSKLHLGGKRQTLGIDVAQLATVQTIDSSFFLLIDIQLLDDCGPLRVTRDYVRKK